VPITSTGASYSVESTQNNAAGALVSNATLVIDNDTTFTINGDISNTGTVQLNGAGNSTILQISGSVTLSGGGAVTLTDSSNNIIQGGTPQHLRLDEIGRRDVLSLAHRKLVRLKLVPDGTKIGERKFFGHSPNIATANDFATEAPIPLRRTRCDRLVLFVAGRTSVVTAIPRHDPMRTSSLWSTPPVDRAAAQLFGNSDCLPDILQIDNAHLAGELVDERAQIALLDEGARGHNGGDISGPAAGADVGRAGREVDHRGNASSRHQTDHRDGRSVRIRQHHADRFAFRGVRHELAAEDRGADQQAFVAERAARRVLHRDTMKAVNPGGLDDRIDHRAVGRGGAEDEIGHDPVERGARRLNAVALALAMIPRRRSCGSGTGRRPDPFWDRE
jgi:hypothetical protein